jgi:ABC-type Zn uptake system ZnuABC Zn-binding protein ZnuA
MNRSQIENELGIQLPDKFEKYDEKIQQNIFAYLKQLDAIEKQAYKIAKSHLGSSFNIIKSNGYNDWLKSK